MNRLLLGSTCGIIFDILAVLLMIPLLGIGIVGGLIIGFVVGQWGIV